MNDAADLHRAIHDNPDDATPGLIYADYVEENRMPHIASVIRAHANDSGDPAYMTEMSPSSPLHGVGPGGFRVVPLQHSSGGAPYSIIVQQRSLADPNRYFGWLAGGMSRDAARRLLEGIESEGAMSSESDLVRKRLGLRSRRPIDPNRLARIMRTYARGKQ